MTSPSTESAVAVLRAQGMRITPQRVAIVDESMRAPGHITPNGLMEEIQARIPGVNASTVYRTLERLREAGVLGQVRLANGVGYHRIDEVRHAHVTCRRCGAERELSPDALAALEQLVEGECGFLPDLTHQVLWGVCQTCRQVPPERLTR